VLVDQVSLDTQGYVGSYKLVGGRKALDLVNTISWPDSEREHDWLTTPGNVRAWMDAVGLAPSSVTESDLGEIHQLRALLADVLGPLAHGQHPPRKAMERFNRCLTGVSTRRHIDPVSLEWTWQPFERARDAFGPVVFDAADLIAHRDPTRLKHCPACDWVFLDQTRNGRRRWCDMADCGSRAKARSYYRRNKT